MITAQQPLLKSKSSGFTLIEVLVTVSILAIITVLSVPNLKKFSQDQILADTSSNLLRMLERARSSSVAKIKCQEKASTGWRVTFSSTDYSLKATCQDISAYPLPSETTETFIIENYSDKGISITTDSGCASGKPDVIFSDNSISFKCSDGSLVASNRLSITLSDNKGNKPVVIVVDKGGAIYEVK